MTKKEEKNDEIWAGHGPFLVVDFQVLNREEELTILYADWESDFAWTEEMEETTKAVCLHCGNALIPDPSLLGRLLPLRMYCGVCE